MTHEPSLEDFTPPHDLVAEKCLLGSFILDPSAYWATSSTVKPEMFYAPVHRTVCNAVGAIYSEFPATQQLDPVVLRERIGDGAGFQGAEKLLLELMQTVPHSDNAGHYAAIVVDRFRRREGLRHVEQSQQEFRDPSRDAQDTIARLDGNLTKLSGDTLESDAVSVADCTDSTLEGIVTRIVDREAGKAVGVSTGSKVLDDLSGGLRPTELGILAARPSMGKTALACNWTLAAARAGNCVLWFSLEQGRTELHERLLCIDGRVDAHRLRIGELDEIDSGELQASANRLRTLPILIDDRASRKVSEISAIARNKVRTHGVKLVVIDYLQLVEAEDSRTPREQQVALITRRLKCLAKDLRIPVVALSQLNRDVENRDNKRPRLSDLRESGAIEQDADVVMFLHRPEVYDANDRPGEADLIVAKNRSGRVGTAPLAFAKCFMRFEDLTQGEW